jgi:hypothetical protein
LHVWIPGPPQVIGQEAQVVDPAREAEGIGGLGAIIQHGWFNLSERAFELIAHISGPINILPGNSDTTSNNTTWRTRKNLESPPCHYGNLLAPIHPQGYN